MNSTCVYVDASSSTALQALPMGHATPGNQRSRFDRHKTGCVAQVITYTWGEGGEIPLYIYHVYIHSTDYSRPQVRLRRPRCCMHFVAKRAPWAHRSPLQDACSVFGKGRCKCNLVWRSGPVSLQHLQDHAPFPYLSFEIWPCSAPMRSSVGPVFCTPVIYIDRHGVYFSIT